MTLTAPLFLLAMAAGAIPIILHLIHRQKAREIPFSTLRFLQVSVQRTRRRKIVDDAALMLLRAGLLAALALALAGPVVSRLRSLWSGSAMAVAIVLDNSASMAQLDGGTPRFDTARERATEILDTLRDGDSVALILTGGPPDPALGTLFRRQETIRQALARATPSAQRADLPARLDQAHALLARSQATHRELYLITDAQAVNWKESRTAAKPETSTSKPPNIPVVVVDVHREPALNVAVQAVALQSPAPTVNVPLQVTATLRNTAGVTQDRTLVLNIDGTQHSLSPTISLPPNGTRAHQFTLTLDRAGIHRGEVRLNEPDGSPIDDAMPFAVVLDQRIPVAIVTARRAEIPYTDDAYYLERALAPAGPDTGAIRIERLTAAALASTPLSPFAVIFAVNLPAPDPEAAQALRAYVKAGGKLFWTAGDRVDASAYNQANTQAGSELLPSPLAPGGPSQTSATLAALDATDPALAPLSEPAALLQTVRVDRRIPFDPSTAGARTLATLADGSPLLVSRPVGSGAVLFLATALRPEWTNLPLRPLFLPMISRLTFALAGAEADRPPIVAGTPIDIPLPSGGEVEVVRPGGEVLRLKPPDANEKSFRYADTFDVGIYLLRPLQQDPPRTRAVAATVDPIEADPAVISADAIRAGVGSQPVTLCTNASELAAAIRRMREGIPLGDLLLTLVLIALVAECLMANRRKALPPGPPPAPPRFAREEPLNESEADPIGALLMDKT